MKLEDLTEADNQAQPNVNIPSKQVLEAFNLSGTPMELPNGSGNVYKVDKVVIKQAGNEQVTSWLADLTNNISSNQFRLAKPLKSFNGQWIFQGWIANQFVEGHHEENNISQSITTCRDFHASVKNISKPGFFDSINGPFYQADKMAWGELPIPEYELIKIPLEKIFAHLSPNTLPNQLIHGDWGFNNLLFHAELPPAIIDITPYFRPADLPIAGMLVHALLEGKDSHEILPLGKSIPDFKQLMLRALAKEILQWVNFQLHPENNEDRTPEIIRRMDLIDFLISEIE